MDSTNTQKLAAPIDPLDWRIVTYGSIKNYLAALDNADEDQAIAMHLKCQQDICENAGIPYHGWGVYALACARQRSDSITVSALYSQDTNNSAYMQWVSRYYNRKSAYYNQPEEELHQYF
ncbi:MAG: hypothetical protein VKO39_13695 [Cyanobacteriota bacterium]|nr:hypothetical protein [Cyanobacteriota bacterium]